MDKKEIHRGFFERTVDEKAYLYSLCYICIDPKPAIGGILVVK